MASQSPVSTATPGSATIINPNDPQNPILSVNMSNVTRLTASNYITWSLQVSLFLDGHNLKQFITNDTAPPPPTLQNNDLTMPNPAYSAWQRQDKLIFAAILGTISVSLQPLVSTATTTLEAWTTLQSTFGRPSRGHMKQIRDQLKKGTKGNRSIDEYLQSIKTKADQLALLGKPLDHEDIIEYILDGLDDDYRGVAEQINGRDVPPTFEEIRDKLVNREAALLCVQPAPIFPISANAATHKPKTSFRPSSSLQFDNRQQQHSYNIRPQQQTFGTYAPRGPKPYLGKCQACGVQGHSAQRCTQFRLISADGSQQNAAQLWQPRAHVASTYPSSDTPSWLLDSGASHHLTSDLNNLALHSPYQGNEAVTLGDGSGHAITHTGSTILSLPSRSIHLNNVLYAPNIEKNLMSVRQTCADNNVSITFDPWSYQVRDLVTGGAAQNRTN